MHNGEAKRRPKKIALVFVSPLEIRDRVWDSDHLKHCSSNILDQDRERIDDPNVPQRQRF